MNHIFLCILSLSFSGTLIGLIILLIHPVTKKFCSKTWNYYIWLLVIISLIFPIHFGSDFANKFKSAINSRFFNTSQTEASIKNVFSENLDNSNSKKALPNNKEKTEDSNIIINNSNLKQTKNNTLLPTFINYASIIWIIGVLFILFIKLSNYLRFIFYVKNNSTQVNNSSISTALNELSIRLSIKNIPKVFETNIISGPITLGLWKTMIILPSDDVIAMNCTASVTFEDITNCKTMLILHHELLHIKRRDLWYKWAYQILLCIHWFNPILYIINSFLNEDCELSCDEKLIKLLTKEGKNIYGNLLIDIAQRNVHSYNIPCTTFLERKKDLKERLGNILYYKKQTTLKIIISLCVLAIMLLITVCSNILTGIFLPIEVFASSNKSVYLYAKQASLMNTYNKSQNLINTAANIKTNKSELNEILNMINYLDYESRDKLMLSIIDTLDFKTIEENIPYMSYEGRERLLTEYIEAGNTLTTDQYANIIFYLRPEARTTILNLILDDEFTYEALENCIPYLTPEGRKNFIIKYIEAGNTLTYSQFDSISPFLDNNIIEAIDNLEANKLK